MRVFIQLTGSPEGNPMAIAFDRIVSFYQHKRANGEVFSTIIYQNHDESSTCTYVKETVEQIAERIRAANMVSP